MAEIVRMMEQCHPTFVGAGSSRPSDLTGSLPLDEGRGDRAPTIASESSGGGCRAQSADNAGHADVGADDGVLQISDDQNHQPTAQDARHKILAAQLL